MRSYFMAHLLCSVAFKNEFYCSFGGMENREPHYSDACAVVRSEKGVNSSKMLKMEHVNDSNINKLIVIAIINS